MLQSCGCYYYIASGKYSAATAMQYLPQVKSQSCTTILSTASRTTLIQTFSNPSSSNIEECFYKFPLYEGVSVVSFTCHVGSRVLRGVVKEKSKAKESYDKAVARGETAGLLEQLPEASDVFNTRLGNIPAGETVHVDITYVGELKHDAEANGIRFTLPTAIAPRYGSQPQSTLGHGSVGTQEQGGIEITVDVNMPEGSLIQRIQSPSHPIAVTLGKTSSSTDSAPGMHRASATLSSASTELDQDFVLILQIIDHNAPKALLETHPTIPNQRALMVTLVPSFSLPPSHPEIVFMVDRSGSMSTKIPTLISALQVFLKSLPVGVKFNICSFGSSHSFLWSRSKAYSHDSLQEAMVHVQGFSANFGGTQTFRALEATIANRLVDLPCEVILLTDGQIWDQTELFFYLNKEVRASKTGLRVFTLGIGMSVSHALVEGIARAGNGFAQTVGENEKFDKKVVRMLKGALSPHLRDCEMEVKYEASGDSDDDFELVEKVIDSLRVLGTTDATDPGREAVQKPISFYEEPQSSDRMEISPSAQNAGADPYAHLPAIPTPKLLQTPSIIPPLFPFSRTVIYILLSEKTVQQTPKSVVLRASSSQGPLELTIPVEELSKPGETIHQLAARKTIQEFEEGRGWIFDSREETGDLLREKFPGQFEEMVEREGVRLGTQFQVSGKWLAFVAVAENGQQMQGIPENNRSSGSDDDSGSDTATAISRSFGALYSSHHSQQSQQRMASVSLESFSTATPQYQQQQQKRSMGGVVFGASFCSTHHETVPPGPQGGAPFGSDGGSLFGAPSAVNRGATLGSDGGESFGASSVLSRGAPSGSDGGRIFGASSAASRGAPSGSAEGGLSVVDARGAPRDSSKARKQTMRESPSEPKITRPVSPSDKVLYSLISLQTFAGFWDLNDELANILSIPRGKLRLENRVWVTLLVVRFLETYMQEEKEVWDLVVDKARRWLGESNLEADAEAEVDRVLKEVKG